jgi:hypothetical protein
MAELDGDIKPRLFDNRPIRNLRDTLNHFFAGIMLCDMVRQWIVEDGPFLYDYRSIKPSGSYAAHKAWVDSIFKNTFGVLPDDFALL